MTMMNRSNSFSRIKEVVTAWGNIRQLLRSGDAGHLVPVVIPNDKRNFGWLFWMGTAVYLGGVLLFINIWLALTAAVFFVGIALLTWWYSAVVEIEEGTTGVVSSYGKIQGTLRPGRTKLWWPWQK